MNNEKPYYIQPNFDYKDVKSLKDRHLDELRERYIQFIHEMPERLDSVEANTEKYIAFQKEWYHYCADLVDKHNAELRDFDVSSQE